ncbi:plant self-incompatibility protein S1 family [Striga asiatica]|uniref:S-protein homolog n=1 Tax=Striga asiatica TaxID=4170 RepID=A0A5A7NXH2_STRAF|nr:plant self-incompatibility protein S1 family [Striga asiatica]
MSITLAKTLLISYFSLFLLIHSGPRARVHALPPPDRGDPPPRRPPGYQVRITNLINHPSLSFRCQSKDNDLGYKTLNFRQYYHWEFQVNFWGSTLFFCHFYWNGKQQVFDAFNASRRTCDTYVDGPYNMCNWIVKGDGFYTVGKKNWEEKDLVKVYSWQ